MELFLGKKFKAPKPTFTSYVDNAGNGFQPTLDDTKHASLFYPIEKPDNDTQLEVDLLPGEVRLSDAQVRRYVPYSDEKNGNIGRLFITNFKMSFVTLKLGETQSLLQANSCRRNKLITADDTALANIENIYYVSKGKRKRLVPGCLIDGNVKHLEIHCKDFQIQTFSLDVEAKSVINALTHHAFPARYDLLFAFYYEGKVKQSDVQFVDYMHENDWQAAVKRAQQMVNLRVSSINKKFCTSPSVPEYFVVPSSLSDSEMKMLASKSKNFSFPIWSYTHQNGASLFRLQTGLSESNEKKILQHVLKLNPVGYGLQVLDASENLPSLKDLQASYMKLRELCMPLSCKEVWSSDMTWYSAIESSQWLAHVSQVLSAVRNIVDDIDDHGCSFVLKESGTNDYTPLLSCLIQLVMDPHSRNQRAFESLIDREWVAFGHCFPDRCGLTAARDNEQSPVFLLFLDCTWQVLQQFPSSFEFTEIYLTSVWDSVTLGVFRNFAFSGVPAASGVMNHRLTYCSMLNVWDWSNQFDAGDIKMFKNPLYVARKYLQKVLPSAVSLDDSSEVRPSSVNVVTSKSGRRVSTSKSNSTWPAGVTSPSSLTTTPPRSRRATFLCFEFRALNLQLWAHCYLRWITPIQIVCGGTPSEYVAQMEELHEILLLQHRIAELEVSLSHPLSRISTVRIESGERSSSLVSPSGSPFVQNSAVSRRVSSSYPYSIRRPSNPAAFLGAQVLTMPRLSFGGEDTMSVDELSLGDNAGTFV